MTKLATYGVVVLGLFAVRGWVAAEEKPTSKPEEFLGWATEWTATEKGLAETAAKSAANEGVRQFAARLAQHYAGCEKELADVSKELKIAVVAAPNRAEREKVAEISKLKGPDFDKQFLQHVIQSDERALKMIDAKNQTNERCRAAAEKATAELRKHIDEARELQKKLGF
jgi:putative membrane protein